MSKQTRSSDMQTMLHWVLRHAILPCFALTLMGCTTTHTPRVYNEPLQQEIREQKWVEVGDQVSITTLDNMQYVFNVERIDDQEIAGDNTIIAIDNIAAIEAQRVSLGKSLGLAAGVTVGYFLGPFLALAILLI